MKTSTRTTLAVLALAALGFPGCGDDNATAKASPLQERPTPTPGQPAPSPGITDPAAMDPVEGTVQPTPYELPAGLAEVPTQDAADSAAADSITEENAEDELERLLEEIEADEVPEQP